MKERGQSESGGQQPVQSESAMLAGKSEMVQTKQIVVEEQQIVQTKQAEVAAESVTMPENIKAAGAAAKIPAETQHLQQKAHRANATQTDPFEKLFVRADYIDAFDDDYFYDCIEVSPEKLKCLNQNEIDIAGNSFLLHGYYNFRHILLEECAITLIILNISLAFRECTATVNVTWLQCLALIILRRVTGVTMPIHISDTGIRRYRRILNDPAMSR